MHSLFRCFFVSWGDRCPGLLQCWSRQSQQWSADLDHVLHPGWKIHGKRYISNLQVAISQLIEQLFKWWCSSRNEWKQMENKWKHTAMQLLSWCTLKILNCSKWQKQFVHLLLQDGRSPLPQAQLTLGVLEQLWCWKSYEIRHHHFQFQLHEVEHWTWKWRCMVQSSTLEAFPIVRTESEPLLQVKNIHFWCILNDHRHHGNVMSGYSLLLITWLHAKKIPGHGKPVWRNDSGGICLALNLWINVLESPKMIHFLENFVMFFLSFSNFSELFNLMIFFSATEECTRIAAHVSWQWLRCK